MLSMIIIIFFDTIEGEGGVRMEFKDLEIFQRVAEKGTITEAAKELNYVQSNITARIHKLEKHLNTKLFNRHNRGMRLTPEGKKLLSYSEKILSITYEMKKVLQSTEEPSGKLEIGSVETVYKLPYILSAYNKKYEHVELSLYSGVSEQLQEKVLNHQLDGAFITSSEKKHPELSYYPVFEEELVLVSLENIKTTEQMVNQPFLCFSQGCGYRRRLEQWFQDQNIAPKKIIELGTLETILRSVRIGLGMTFVPKSSVSSMIEAKEIYWTYLPKKYRKIQTVFIRRKDAYLTSTIEKFIETIEKSRHSIIQS